MSEFLLFFTCLLVWSATFSSGKEQAKHLRLDLIHRQALQYVGGAPQRTRLELFKEIAHNDRIRWSFAAAVSSRRGRVTAEVANASNSTFKMPMTAGAYAGIGLYLAELQIGSPAKTFIMAVDTGSDLTWVNCKKQCKGKCGAADKAFFIANASSTFKPIHCSSKMCDQVSVALKQCKSKTSPCAYEYGYTDGLEAQGTYAHETATVKLSTGKTAQLKNLVIGCTTATKGRVLGRPVDGILGLGQHPESFAFKAAQQYGDAFSYCLVDHLSPKNATSYLNFGPPLSSPLLTYTNISYKPALEPFYLVEVAGISIGNTILKIPVEVWDPSKQGGTIVDSGTSLTMLVEPAYEAVVAELSKSLKSLPRVEMDPFEYCYNITVGYKESMVPKLRLQFRNGVKFEPPVKSYVIATADGVKCLGFLSTPWPGVSVLGNILQQNFYWQFDLLNSKLGFMPSPCAR